MYDWLVPRVIFPLYERVSGRRFWTEVLQLRELQWHAAGELEARTFQKLRILLTHAVAHVPYYRDLFRRAGIHPEDLHAISDLARVPITTKENLRAEFPARTTAENLPVHRRWKTATSGSTGFPFEFYTDRATMDSWIGSYLFFLEWAGTALWEPQLILANPSSPAYRSNMPHPPMVTRGVRRILLGEQVTYLPGMELTPTKLRDWTGRQSPDRPYFIRTYPSYAAHLAAWLLEEKVGLLTYPKVVICGGESLTPANATVIPAAFRCPVVNHYSTWEVPHMAQTCPDARGVLHVNSERVILRVVRDDGATAAPGEPGRVVITALTNYVMPFINYDLGDLAVAGHPCPCGRGFPTLVSINGRQGQLIRTPSGKIIAPASLTNFLTFICPSLPYVWEYQAVQTHPDTVILRVVPTAHFTDTFARILTKALEGFLGPGMTATIETLDRIPREPSEKRFLIKSCLPPP